jgi:GrpB-like predicted nucleotidyltransferase (UPF0157 family)
MELKKSEAVYALAKEYFDIESDRMQALFPNLLTEHVGGTAIPGAITKGDLDIQVRVTSEDFKKVCEVLKEFYHVNHPELWNDELAIFHRKDHPVIPMSIMVTVIDSPYDEYALTRDVLKNNLELLKKYNQIKLSYVNKDETEYSIAKKNFFGPNGKRDLLR